ncbi:PREDICTED: putative uncharacterized protein DDB_G0277255 [Ipomoea nil]|uniref:putative uncharacterized protein DDB_G0277255 n=1 Tax=Ipomoea nil TaxID=35883 RepID=UPI000901D39C|nr:PREDICTED: putative uncharacterized protein DDB_G0277255 [Ipomoea nil]
MATRVRESGVRGKEKKGNQADNTMPQQHKRITTTNTTSRLMSSSSSSVANNSVPNYLRPTTASAAVQGAGGDKPISSRRKSLDKPLLPNLETAHRNLAGDKPSPARRKSFDRPIIQPPHSPLSSSPLSSSSLAPKPTFSRTKSSLDNSKPKSSTRTSEANDRRGKIMSRSISSVSKSSSSSSPSPIAHNNHLLNRPTTPKTPQKNSTRKQPGTTLLSPKPVKKKPAETIHILTSNHHQEPSVPVPESPDHHTEVSANNPDSNQTEINNNNNKIVQEKENINVVVSDNHEELEDNLNSIEDCSSLLSDPPILDPLDTITEEGEISAPENLQEIGQNADTIPPPEDHPQVEDKDNNLKETTPADDEVSVEEVGDDETMQNISDNNNCSEDKAENQEEEEEEEEREKEKEKERDKKPDNHHHHQELADEEVKEITNDQNNNNNNNVVVVQSSSPEASKPALKRNESVVSNDVIEETASKLREQRKNKVKTILYGLVECLWGPMLMVFIRDSEFREGLIDPLFKDKNMHWKLEGQCALEEGALEEEKLCKEEKYTLKEEKLCT